MVPTLAGLHHLKLPVSDLERSVSWYGSRLGYEVALKFFDNGTMTGVSMLHPAGGPQLGLYLSPEKARTAAGFDYFSIGVPDRRGMVELADHLTALGEKHGGVHFATLGWILPLLHDPDGHEVRFYTMEEHTELDPTTTLVVDDAVASAMAAELVWLEERGLDPVPDGSVYAP